MKKWFRLRRTLRYLWYVWFCCCRFCTRPAMYSGISSSSVFTMPLCRSMPSSWYLQCCFVPVTSRICCKYIYNYFLRFRFFLLRQRKKELIKNYTLRNNLLILCIYVCICFWLVFVCDDECVSKHNLSILIFPLNIYICI